MKVDKITAKKHAFSICVLKLHKDCRRFSGKARYLKLESAVNNKESMPLPVFGSGSFFCWIYFAASAFAA